MKIYQNIEQGTQEWFDLKAGKFGSSDASTLATNGKGLETLCYKKVAEILIGNKSDGFTNEHMQRGIELEPMARSAYEIEKGILVDQVGYIELGNHVGGSPDGLVGDDGLIEIKCPSDPHFIRMIYQGKIDSSYMWQMQHLMYVSDRSWCDFVVFSESLNKINIQRVERDEASIKKLEAGLKAGVKRIEDILKKVG
jgi:putative phage-type endonuclease